MPWRQEPLITGEYYHVLNRGIYKQNIFRSEEDYQRALITLKYYRYQNTPTHLSHFLKKNDVEQQLIFEQLEESKKRVEIVAYCLMPNHFHLLLKQVSESGISNFLADFQNSHTKAYNARHQLQGVLLNRQFKAFHLESDEDLLQVFRYIHLNPYMAKLISKNEIFTYPWSSAQEYESGISNISNLELFNLLENPAGHEDFILDLLE